MALVEVFKTNINCTEKAVQLLEKIHASFSNCKANFDLEDCDRILRIVIHSGSIEITSFIKWLQHTGCYAELLTDN